MATMINGLVMRPGRSFKSPEVDKRIMRMGNLGTAAYADDWDTAPTRYYFYTAPVANTLLSWILKGTAKLGTTGGAITATPFAVVYWVLVIEREGANGTVGAFTVASVNNFYVPEQNVLASGTGILTQDTTATTAGTYRLCNWTAESSSSKKLQLGDHLVLIARTSTLPANVAIGFEFILEAYFSN